MEKAVFLFFVIGCEAFSSNERLPSSWQYPFEYNYAVESFAYCNHLQPQVPMYMKSPRQLIPLALCNAKTERLIEVHPNHRKVLGKKLWARLGSTITNKGKQMKNSTISGSIIFQEPKIDSSQNMMSPNQNKKYSYQGNIILQEPKIGSIQNITSPDLNKQNSNQNNIILQEPKTDSTQNIISPNLNKNYSNQDSIILQEPKTDSTQNITSPNLNKNYSNQDSIILQEPKIGSIQNMTSPNQNKNYSYQGNIILQELKIGSTQNMTSLNLDINSAKQNNTTSNINRPFTNQAKVSLNGTVCFTEACNDTAARITSYMNPEVHPCTDFYEFSCGKFLKINLSEAEGQKGSISQLTSEVDEQLIKLLSENSTKKEIRPLSRMRKYYKSCMDIERIDARGLKNLKRFIRRAGGWPVLDKNWDPDKWDTMETEIRLEKIFHFKGVFMEVGVSTDLNNSSRKILAVDQPNDLGLNMEYLVEGLENPMVQEHFRYMKDLAVAFGASKERAEEELLDALKLSIDIAKICSDRLSRVDIDRMKNYFTLGTLKIRWKWMNWDRLFKRLLPMGLHLPEDHEILVTEQSYITNLEHVLRNYTKETIANFMLFITVKRLSPLLPSALLEMLYTIADTVGPPYPNYPRSALCLDYTKENFPEALAALYVRKSVRSQSLQKLKDMVERIRLQMVEQITEVPWMDKKTKQRAKEKASKIIEVLGYSIELTDDNALKDFYRGLPKIKNDILENTWMVKEWQNVYIWKGIMEEVNKTDWRDYSSQIIKVNAFYDPFKNMIAIPAAILNLPFFHPDVPWYLNYGAVGTIIGHEITHGFDNSGRKYDAEGRLFDWWDEESTKNYVTQKQCFVDQYGSFNDTRNTNLMVNGVTTEDENIADNGGLKLAYRAYKKHITEKEQTLVGLEQYTQEQLFFISMASMWCTKKSPDNWKNVILFDTHSPEEFRVTGMLQNLPDFSKIFGCDANHRMNPEKKCSVW